MKLQTLTLGACLTAAPLGAIAGTVAFYDFSEGADGEDVTTMQNASGLDATYSGKKFVADDASVKYSADVPAPWLFASKADDAERISTTWKSIDFTLSEDNKHGGYVAITGLGEKMAELGQAGAFTIECFVKVKKFLDWKDVFKFFYAGTLKNGTTTTYQQAKFVEYATKFGFQMDATNPTFSGAVQTETWNHVAVVYTKGAEDELGTWRMYWNGTLFATQYSTITGPASAKTLYLGGAGTDYENLSGKITGLRVSDCALAPNEFMKASAFDKEKSEELGGVLALWTFEEGVAGANVTNAPNVVDVSDGLVGAPLGTAGVCPAYSDDVPGRTILSGATNRTVIARNVKSVKFYGTEDNASGSRLTIMDVRSRMAKKDAFTLEFFCKEDDYYTWRNVYAMYVSSTNSFKSCMRYSEYQFGMQWFFPGYENSQDLYYVSDTPFLGNWRHIALEWDAESQKLSTYVDYAKRFEVDQVTFDDTPGNGYFGCTRTGGEGEYFSGKIACVRLSPRRLAPCEMMIPSNADVSNYDDKTLFHWSFEDAVAEDGKALGIVDAAPVNSAAFRGTASQQRSEFATYSTEVLSPLRPFVKQGDAILCTNRFSAYFYGYSDKHDDQWAGSHVEQQTVLDGVTSRTTNYTFETFLRLDTTATKLNGANGELIAGFGASGIDTQISCTDWTLRFSGYGIDYLIFAGSYEDLDEEGNVSIKNEEFSVKTTVSDGQWHHVAVTCDGETQTVTIYFDYEKLGEHVFTKGLRCTTDKNWRHAIGRGFNSSGFNGWMDDVRLSSVVRTPDEFLRKGVRNYGTAVLVK